MESLVLVWLETMAEQVLTTGGGFIEVRHGVVEPRQIVYLRLDAAAPLLAQRPSHPHRQHAKAVIGSAVRTRRGLSLKIVQG
jgi:hypothetical protein